MSHPDPTHDPKDAVEELLLAAKRIVSKDGKDRIIGSETFEDRAILLQAIARVELSRFENKGSV